VNSEVTAFVKSLAPRRDYFFSKKKLKWPDGHWKIPIRVNSTVSKAFPSLRWKMAIDDQKSKLQRPPPDGRTKKKSLWAKMKSKAKSIINE